MRGAIDDYVAAGADRAAVEALPRVQFTPRMAPEAYHGLAGRIVETIEPHSEADPVAILMHVLVAAGNLIGRGPHALVEKTVHTCNEFAVLVGPTSKGRKGQAWSTPRWMLGQVDEVWAKTRIRSGLSSGEGVIYHVRDPREEQQPVKERGRVVDYQTVVVDAGEADKRLLVIEPEFATVLRRMQGETNSLSSVLREAWESGTLSTLTKNSPMLATGAHISIIAHTTPEELVTSLTDTDRANGFANRFMYIMTRRSKFLPETVSIADEKFAPLTTQLREVVQQSQRPRLLTRDAAARVLWAAVYEKLSVGEAGLLGAVLARGEAHVLRLSLIYAALDGAPAVQPEHLRAALAIWDFADASARRIFGDRMGISVADTILEALRQRGPLTKTQINNIFHRNKPAADIDAALRLLAEGGKARRSTHPPEGGDGRSVEVWEAMA